MSINKSLILQIYGASFSQNDDLLSDLLKSQKSSDASAYLGAALGMAASVCNVVAVECLIANQQSWKIAPNGAYGLGRALFFGSQTGSLEIVRKILQHQNASQIHQHGKYSLMHARVTALSINHQEIVELVSKKLNLV